MEESQFCCKNNVNEFRFWYTSKFVVIDGMVKFKERLRSRGCAKTPLSPQRRKLDYGSVMAIPATVDRGVEDDDAAESSSEESQQTMRPVQIRNVHDRAKAKMQMIARCIRVVFTSRACLSFRCRRRVSLPLRRRRSSYKSAKFRLVLHSHPKGLDWWY